MNKAQMALARVGELLREGGYAFTTVTPQTHRRVLARDAARSKGLGETVRDVFGWNKPFASNVLPAPMHELLLQADACAQEGELWRSRIRFSTLGSRLFVHSAFPTEHAHAVFFGPDTYRFCLALERFARPARRVVDVGCGSGAGGLVLASTCQKVVLADINPLALSFAQVNAQLAGVDAEIVHSDVLASVEGDVDLVVANPPYLLDPTQRVYRDGGGQYGEALAVRIVQEGLARLSSGGQLIVYTGAAVVAGVDQFLKAVTPLLQAAGARHLYTELDPDVFGEELDCPGYEQTERLAAVALVAELP